MFNLSSFGIHCHQLIPAGSYFLADDGFQLFEHIITPYSIRVGMSRDESHTTCIAKQESLLNVHLGVSKTESESTSNRY